MSKSLIRWPLRTLKWLLCAAGATALLLTVLVAVPLKRLPELRSISETARAVDRSTMPAVERFSPATARSSLIGTIPPARVRPA